MERQEWNRPGIVDRFRELALSTENSFSDIAEILAKEFGAALTRNACIGKAHRMGIKLPPQKRYTLLRRPHKNPKPRKHISARHRGAQGTSRATRIVERKKTLAELFGVMTDGMRDLPQDQSPFATTIEHLIHDMSQCRWPVTTPDGEWQLFCADQTVPNRPYCIRHCHAAYQIARPAYVSESKRAA